MESSDEEGEIVPDCVMNYYFVDYNGNPVSFTNLPLRWSDTEIPNDASTQIILRGTSNCGLQKIYKKVIAWRLELSYVVPEIYVLSKDKMWIKIQKPRKSFEVTIKTILVTAHFLHFVKKNLETSEDALWGYLLQAFSSFEVEPSKNDLLYHMSLIKTAKTRDKDIENSKYLTAFLLEISGEREAFDEEHRTTNMSNFDVDSDDYHGGGGGDDDEYEDELFDYVCAICDNGGDLLACEGRCIRSFHATVDAAAESLCESLGYTDAQVDAIQSFLCKNCQHLQHQCFVCGKLGSSNKSSGVEVFPCVSATCGHFYHPKCVAELLHPMDGTQAKELQEKILAGESFICPAHKCVICKHGEDKKINDLQFALCRRCPKAYHRRCLPRKIAFEVDDENNHQRAWDGLLPNRILIYCMAHRIVPELGTPARNHILFPDGDGRRKHHTLGSPSTKEKVPEAKKTNFLSNLTGKTGGNIQKSVDRTRVSVQCGESISEKGVTMKSFKDNNMSVSGNLFRSSSFVEKSKLSLRNDQSNTVASIKSYLNKSKQPNIVSEMTNNMSTVIKASSSLPPVDAEMENRILTLMKTSTSSFNMEEFIKGQRRLSSYSYSSKAAVDKTITKGKVEGSVKAVRAAMKKLEEDSSSVEDAKAVCEPEILKQIIRWKRKLGIYLAPFLNGMRYTSFGRHFTKVDKLKEIVDRLQWYVQDGDMIVDFCCGSNDFSCLMKEKLEKMRKSCSFKNFDLFTPKNDFNFEKRDWMSVRVGELPAGSNLIMGLNPPFGDHASLANKFIEQALKFKPKLLVLIVPKETKRLDKQNPSYDLIWEDDEILAGKSFYLPGSVDVHNQQMDQWNLNTPPLYLWSRPDWTARHIEIAQKQGHLHNDRGKRAVSNYLMDENHDCFGDFSNVIKGCDDISRILDDVPEHPCDTNIPFGQDGKSLAGKWDIEEKFEDMCVDMEISPVNSPINWQSSTGALPSGT